MLDELGKTDLVRLSAEVEDAESALPHNLSDDWLKRIARDLEVVLESDGDEKWVSECLSAPLFLILRIWEHKERQAGNITGQIDYLQFRRYL